MQVLFCANWVKMGKFFIFSTFFTALAKVPEFPDFNRRGSFISTGYRIICFRGKVPVLFRLHCRLVFVLAL